MPANYSVGGSVSEYCSLSFSVVDVHVCPKRMCSPSSTERKRTRRWLLHIEKIRFDLKNRDSTYHESFRTGVEPGTWLETSAYWLGHRPLSHELTPFIGRFHGRAPHSFKLGAGGVPGLGFWH